MSDGDIEFPEAPLSPSLPTDFLDPHDEARSLPDPAPLPDPAALPDPALPDPAGTAEGDASKKRQESRRDAPQDAKRDAKRQGPLDGNKRGEESLESSPQKPKAAAGSDERSKELNGLMVKWVGRARAKKHESDRASKDRKHRLAAVLALDAVVCFMIGFDYENRSEAARTGSSTTGPVHPRSWGTLVPYLAKLASAVESVDADLAGVYYQVCAVVRLHVVYLKRKSVPPEESASGLYAALADFRRGLCLLPLHIIHNRYALNEEHGWIQAKLNPDRPDPLGNCAALPLHVNSSLAEAAAFALNIGRKWAQLEGLDYVWDAARS